MRCSVSWRGRYLWASYDCMDYNGGVMLIHPALADPQSVIRGKRNLGGVLMMPSSAVCYTDILPEEIPLQKELECAIAGVRFATGRRAEECCDNAASACASRARRSAHWKKFCRLLCQVYVSDSMRAALSDLYIQTPKWVAPARSVMLQ